MFFANILNLNLLSATSCDEDNKRYCGMLQKHLCGTFRRFLRKRWQVHGSSMDHVMFMGHWTGCSHAKTRKGSALRNEIRAQPHLSCGTANQYSGCLPRPPNEWLGLEVNPEVKDFLIGFPTLKQRNIGGFLLLSSDEKIMSVEFLKKEAERESVSVHDNGYKCTHRFSIYVDSYLL